MQMEMKVTYVDGKSVTVTSRRFDAIQLERHRGQPFVKIAGVGDPDGPSFYIEDMWFMAWCASRRADKTGVPDDFDVWAETVEDVEMGDSEVDNGTPLDRTP
jgi:hypothetical protein